MDLQPYRLDHWLARYEASSPPIRFNLATSMGASWTVGELVSICGGIDELSRTTLGYAPPEGSFALREAIASQYDVDPEHVVVTTGASEAISILFCLFSGPGRNLVLPRPAFPAFETMARAWGLGTRHYTLSHANGFVHEANAILSAADTETALVLVNTPFNPAGSVLPHAQLDKLVLALDDRGIPLVVDEVYHPVYFGRPQQSAASIPNAIVLGDLSKAYNLPGLRIGWIIDRDVDRRKRIIDARSYFTISGSPLLEAIATQAIIHRDVLTQKLMKNTVENLAVISDFMERQSETLSWMRPEGGNTAFPWFSDRRHARPFCELLAVAGVLVVPGDCFGADEHFRLGFAGQRNGLDQALSIMGSVLRSLPRTAQAA